MAGKRKPEALSFSISNGPVYLEARKLSCFADLNKRVG